MSHGTTYYKSKVEVEYIVGSSDRSLSKLLKQDLAKLAYKAGLIELIELSLELRKVVI